MILKINSMLKVEIPKNNKLSKKDPADIAKTLENYLNEAVLPPIQKKENMEVKIHVNADNIRVGT